MHGQVDADQPVAQLRRQAGRNGPGLFCPGAAFPDDLEVPARPVIRLDPPADTLPSVTVQYEEVRPAGP